MFQNYIQIALRTLLKNKLYSAINIIGLAVGLAACILITLFVQDELSYDKFWAKSDKIYRLNTSFAVPGREPFVTVATMGPAKEALKRFFDGQIDHTVRFNNGAPIITVGDKVFEEEVSLADPEAADIFDFTVLKGDLKASLNDTMSIALSRSLAVKYFGSIDVIGKVMTFTNYKVKKDYRVGAVYEDLPHNTVLKIPAMVKIVEEDYKEMPWVFASWFSVNNTTFFTLKDGVSIEDINKRIKDFTNANITLPPAFANLGDSSNLVKFSTMALTDIQLNSAGAGEMKPTGSKTNVIVFLSIAGLILVIGCINYMNLSTARALRRAREVSLRKVLGARRQQLVAQFLGESMLLATICLLFAIVIVELVLPFYSDYLGKELVFDYTNTVILSVLFGLVLMVGLLGGLYPAFVLSSFRPAAILKANKSAETSSSLALRNILVVLQFSVSIALIIGTAGVYAQKLYATTMDPGFNRENLIVVHGVGRDTVIEKSVAFKNEVLKDPSMIQASIVSDYPSQGNENNLSISLPDSGSSRSFLIGTRTVDQDYLKTYQIKLVTGRFFDKNIANDVGYPKTDGKKKGEIVNSNVVLNEAAVRSLGFGTPQEALGKMLRMNRGGDVLQDMQVIGVIADTHYQSMRQMLRPEVYLMQEKGSGYMTVRVEGNPSEAAERLQSIWQKMISDVPFVHTYIDEAMAREFAEEDALVTLLAIFSILAVLVACLGLYGLAIFTAERRTKEIGIRKVMGAGVMDIVRLLVWQFSKPVLIANLIAWPITIAGLVLWLESFPYRIDSLWLLPLCILSGAIAMLIAWGTVGGNAMIVARSNPIKALRYE